MSEQIDQFFRPDGTLISIPVKPAKKMAVLTHIAQELSPTTKYPEKELNLIIAKYHDDTAAIRRHMIEYGILERDGESVYWGPLTLNYQTFCQSPLLLSPHDH